VGRLPTAAPDFGLERFADHAEFVDHVSVVVRVRFVLGKPARSGLCVNCLGRSAQFGRKHGGVAARIIGTQ
jgi:hypothetical protein